MGKLFEFSSAPTKTVGSVQFSVWSPDEIRAHSVAQITSRMYKRDGVPVDGGLLDPRLGTVDRLYRCKTCLGDRDSCPGHFGHIELAKPVFHYGFLTYVLKVLRLTCYHCSALLIDASSPDVQEALRGCRDVERLHVLARLNIPKACSGGKVSDLGDIDVMNGDVSKTKSLGCGNHQPTYRKDITKIWVQFDARTDLEDESQRKVPLSAEKVLQVFRRIRDEDCKVLGFDSKFSRPEWMVLTVLPVPPPHVRPSVQMASSMEGQDDLTYKYGDIVSANEDLRRMEMEGKPAHILAELNDLLQYHIISLMDNEVSGLPKARQRGGKALRSIRQRLVGKTGRVRGNLMGKRVDFSARTVITGDANLSVDEVGVPKSIAMNLTFPETVTRFNIKNLTKLVRNGPNEHPGAKAIIRTDNQVIDLRYVKKSQDVGLEIGYIVERHVQDGDVVLFNRQPSLHKMSIMAHRVKILPWSTFRLNLCVTSPYNADFDGDEMNLHVPQTHETRAEAMELMMVPKQIVSPQANRPVIGIVQDALLGCRKFTLRDTFLERGMMMNLLMWLDNWDGVIPTPAILKPRPLWTGKQVFSMILPKVNLDRIANGHPDNETGLNSPGDTVVKIIQGRLMAGICDKRTLGTSEGSLVHVIFKEYGPLATRDFLNSVQRVVNNWLLSHGFSVGIADTIADSDSLIEIDNKIKEAKVIVEDLIAKAHSGKLERQPGSSSVESFEAQVNQALNHAANEAGTAAQNSLLANNNIKAMVDAGSKGSTLNICQIIACVGQQNVEGKRIPFGFRDRTLPHFTKNDLGPESRGFVENSYLKGLTPEEFFFHAMGGREGLVDTAVKTAETGYIQRRLVKAMEDVSVKYDGTVRDSRNNVIQFLYGEDGLAGEMIEKQKLELLSLNNSKFMDMYSFEDEFGNFDGSWLPQETYQKLIRDPDAITLVRDEYKTLLLDRQTVQEKIAPLFDYDTKVFLPTNLKRIVWTAQKKFHVERESYADVDPRYVMRELKKLSKDLVIVHGNDALSVEAQHNSTLLFNIYLRSTLAAKRVIREWKLSKAAFDWVLQQVRDRFQKANVHPSEMVGVIAAQSIGEPATQMTLNTFHFAGVSAKNVTLGVPRLKEIINLATTLRTPSLTVYLQPEIAQDQVRAQQTLSQLEYTTLGDIAAKTEIFYDPDPEHTVVEQDREFMEAYFELPDEEFVADEYSPWMLRLVLDRTKKEAKHLSNSDIGRLINDTHAGVIKCMFNNDNAPELVFQIRMRSMLNGNKEEGDVLESEELMKKVQLRLLSNMVLRGIPGIEKVFMRKEKRKGYRADGSLDVNAAEEWVLDTEGIALADVMCVEGVDHTRTVSNHVKEILEVLGIEAARAAILNEIRRVISFDGSYVNYRHLAMLVDCMTFRGTIMPITRHGINRVDKNALTRCSFEETVEILVEAAVFSEKDILTGVSDNVLMGKLATLGTGEFDLMLNRDALQDAVELPEMMYGMQDYGTVEGTPFYDAGTPFMQSPSATFGGMFTPGGMMSPFSPTSPGPMSPTSPAFAASPFPVTSPAYSPTSPTYSPTSPTYSPTSPTYSPTSPTYSPTSPTYSPTSPTYSPTSPTYSPTSPTYSPTSPTYSPTSPTYSPTSPTYSPTSPMYSPTSPTYSPTSPTYSPTSPTYSPTSPTYSPTSPTYSPTSPTYSPTSPTYSPTSPTYSPTSPTYSPTSPTYSPTSPTYSPTEGDEDVAKEK